MNNDAPRGIPGSSITATDREYWRERALSAEESLENDTNGQVEELRKEVRAWRKSACRHRNARATEEVRADKAEAMLEQANKHIEELQNATTKPSVDPAWKVLEEARRTKSLELAITAANGGHVTIGSVIVELAEEFDQYIRGEL